jgi:hypothetical protein
MSVMMITLEGRLSNKNPEINVAEKNNVTRTVCRTIEPDREVAEPVMKSSSLPDEVIIGMSRSELDAFHKS